MRMTTSMTTRGWRATPATLPGLSVSQPWAEAILARVKTIETRSWATSYRGPLVLHAGRSWWRGRPDDPAGATPRRGSGESASADRAAAIALRLGLPAPCADYPRGALVGVAEIRECFRFTAASWERLRAQHGCDWAWVPGTSGWVLANARRLARPLPYRGALGLFAVPAALIGDGLGARPRTMNCHGWIRDADPPCPRQVTISEPRTP